MLTDRSATALISFVLTVVLVFSSLIAMAPFYTSGETSTPLQVEPTSDLYVKVGDNYFDPDDIEVEPGDEIEFENIGDIDHTVTIEDTEYDEVISPGESVFVTIEEEGVYDLDCTFHLGMDGTITVGEPGPELIDHTLEVEPEEGVEPLEVDIEVSVENVGEEDGEESIYIEEEFEIVNVPAGEMVDEEYSYTFEEAGNYLVEFGDQETEITVEEDLETVYVEVGDNYFDPDEIEIDPGQPLEFENVGDVDHTVTIEEADIDEYLEPGDSVIVVIEEEGVYDLECTIHAGQDGTIAVGEELPEDEMPGFTFLTFLAVISGSVIIWGIYKRKND